MSKELDPCPMTLEEAIAWHEGYAEYDKKIGCPIIAGKNNQYADWLRELQERRKQPEWIPVMDGDGVLPEVDEDGYSDFVLVSFSNVSGLDIGQYREDENGGAFYSGDDDDPYTKIGAFVNAWMPLPKPYREEDLR